MTDAVASPVPWFFVVSLTAIATPAAAAAGPVSADTARSGATSSLVSVTVALPGEPTWYPGPSVRDSETVSFDSTIASSMGVTVTVALAAPSAMVTVAGSGR